MTTAWAHIPNAALIDEVLTSLRTHPKKWIAIQDTARNTARSAARSAAWDAVRGAVRDATRDAAWNAARDAAWNAVWGTAWGAARDAARGAARDAAWNTVQSAAWVAAGDVIAALIAYDDASQFMKLPAEQLKVMYRLDPHPMYLLLQPTAVVFMGVEP